MAVCSEEAARRHIERIARAYQDGSEELKDSLAGALERVTMMFPQTGHFLMEFLQNADDAGASSVWVELGPDGVRIANDGAPFSEADVESICRVGRSAKRPADYIGYLGIGFKSVFLFCDSPRIVSGCYRFAFERGRWAQPERVPWQITPAWLESVPRWVEALPSYRTFFDLPFRESSRAWTAELLQRQLGPDGLPARVLLFLQHIRGLILHDRISDARRTLRREILERVERGPAPYELVEITEERDGSSSGERWVVFRETVEVPKEVRGDPETIRWQREDVVSRQVAAAFALDNEGQLRPVAGTAHMGVFSFLPLREVRSGLAFLVQGDFLTGPGRETVRRDALWNRWMARELSRFVTQRVVPALLAHERWRYVAAELLYPGEGGPDVLDEELLKPLRRYVETQPVLVAADGSLVTHRQAMQIVNWDDEWVRALDVRDVEAVFPGQRVLHRLTRVPQSLSPRQALSVNSRRWPWEMDELVEARAKAGDVAFFKALYHDLSRYADNTIRSAPWRSSALVLTEDGNLVPGSAAYWADQGPAKLGSLRRVHPELWAIASPQVV